MPFKAEVSPIASASSQSGGIAYLEIVPYDGGVRVQRTDAGRSLNPFWTVWLRQLILEKTDPKHGFAVELRGQDVFVSSNTTAQGLMETVRAFGCQLHPLPDPPMKRRHLTTTRRIACWDTEIDLMDCLASLRLPGKAHLKVWPHFVMLERGQKDLFRTAKLALMVEYHVTRCLYLTTT